MKQIVEGESIDVSLRLDGENIVEAIDIRDLSIVLSEAISILDNTYCVLSNQTRLSNQAKSDFQMKATDIHRGSLEFVVNLSVAAMQLVVPVLGWVNPYSIWEYTVHAFDLLSLVHSHKRSDSNSKSSSSGFNFYVEEGANVVVGDNNKIIIPDKKVVEISQKSFDDYKRLSQAIGKERIGNVSFKKVGDNSKTIRIDEENKNMFETSTTLDDTPVWLYVDILRFDKEKLTGRLRVYESQCIPESEYSFSVIGNQDCAPYIDSMFRDAVQIKALTENRLDALRGLVPHKLQVMKIESE